MLVKCIGKRKHIQKDLIIGININVVNVKLSKDSILNTVNNNHNII